MGKLFLWNADRIKQDADHRLLNDTLINKFNNVNPNVIDWNQAIEPGFYGSAANVDNSPIKNTPLAGEIVASENFIIQKVYPDMINKTLEFYVRKGTINDTNNITWDIWYKIKEKMELINGDNTTYIIKGYDSSSSVNLFTGLIPSTVTSIIFTDIDIAIDATLIDVDEDGDGGVVAWLDTSDNTKMYVSTQYAGIKVEGNINSSKLFYSNSNLTELNLSNFDTSNVKDMSYMFSGCVRLSKLIDFNLNTNSATDMRAMFYNCSKLTTLDLSSFNTSAVTTMSYMFQGCTSLNSLDLSNFDTSNVSNTSYMFDMCSNLEYLNVSSFNTTKISNMIAMFWKCNKLKELDLSSFDTTNTINMQSMFSNCTSLTSLDLSSFDTNKVSYMDSLFTNCHNLTTIKVGNKFKWITTLNKLGLVDDTWQDETGTQYTPSDTFPSNVAHTYTKVL